MPEAVPGAADSPGANSCSFVNTSGLTVIVGLVLAVTAVCVTFEATTVALPAVLRVMLKLLLPFTSEALAGKTAFESLEPIEAVSLVLTTFQFASTAFTVTLKAPPAVCIEGAPVFPLAVPGAAASPGISNCILTIAPARTVTAGLVEFVLAGLVVSLAVIVGVPAVLSVILKILVPFTSAASTGTVAFASEELMWIESETVLMMFQLLSTALTVTLKAVPAV